MDLKKVVLNRYLRICPSQPATGLACGYSTAEWVVEGPRVVVNTEWWVSEQSTRVWLSVNSNH